MNPVRIQLPSDAQVSNYLYPDMTAADLTQDMLTVRLASGHYIDVGWYPEHDPAGSFLIRVFHEFWDRQIAGPVAVHNLHEVVFHVERLAERYSSGPIIPSSRSGGATAMRVLV